ncbi:unnamed protein product [Protopolystoma xenopodis]|uniref:Uncharacterized protein n=1 Tax=Protopolystoma xenopodis TaxID=117903 RepID=A0A448XCZ3_9PLAT|nr:unnamed protein product [Protopolystoma xenopodis]
MPLRGNTSSGSLRAWRRHFPLTSIENVMCLFSDMLGAFGPRDISLLRSRPNFNDFEASSDPNLAFISIILGYIEHRLTVGNNDGLSTIYKPRHHYASSKASEGSINTSTKEKRSIQSKLLRSSRESSISSTSSLNQLDEFSNFAPDFTPTENDDQLHSHASFTDIYDRLSISSPSHSPFTSLKSDSQLSSQSKISKFHITTRSSRKQRRRHCSSISAPDSHPTDTTGTISSQRSHNVPLNLASPLTVNVHANEPFTAQFSKRKNISSITPTASSLNYLSPSNVYPVTDAPASEIFPSLSYEEVERLYQEFYHFIIAHPKP